MAEQKKEEFLDEIEESELDHDELIDIDAEAAELEKLDEVTAERDDYRDKFMRALADAENARKRADKDRKEILENESQDTLYLKQIAKLEIEVENNKKNNKRFSQIVNELISLRGKLRKEENYELSDTIRDILESCNLQIEDNGNDIKWSIID